MVPLDAIVLDIGCGTVKPTASMIVDSGSKVHGIDFSSGMISICREQVSKGFFEQADILDYQPSSRFDAVIATFSLLSFSHAQMISIIGNIFQWVKPGGYFFYWSIASGQSS